MKKVKLSTPFWLGDTVYGVLAFSAGERKIKQNRKLKSKTTIQHLLFRWTKTAMKLCRMLSPNVWRMRSNGKDNKF